MKSGLKSKILLLPTLAAVVWLPLASGGADNFPLLWIQIGTFAILAVSAAMGWISIQGPKLFWVAIGWTVVSAGISTIFSKDLEASMPAFMQWLWLGAIALLVASVARSDRKTIGGFLVGALIIQVIWGFFVWWGGGDPANNQSGTFYAPNQYAGYLLLLAPFLIANALTTKARGEAAAWGVMGALACLGVLLSGSRGGLVALVIGAIATLVITTRLEGRGVLLRALLFVALAGGLGLLLTSSLVLKDRATGNPSDVLENVESKGSASPSTNMRVDWVKGAIRIGSRFPVTGGGLGTYGDLLVQVQEPSWFWSRYAHNHYSEALAEGGVPFALGVLAIPLVALVSSYKKLRQEGLDPLSVGAFAGLLAGSSHLIVDHDWSYPAYAVAFVVTATLLVFNDPQELARNIRKRSTRVLGATLCVLVLVVLSARAKSLFLLRADASNRTNGAKAVDLAPYSAAARQRSAQDLLASNLLPSAEKAIEQAIAIDELEPRLLWQAAEIYALQSDLEAARRAYKQAILIAPNAPVSYELAARFDLNSGNANQAAQILDQGLSRLSQHPRQTRLRFPLARLLVLRAQVSERLGELDQAVSFSKEATGRAPTYSEAWFTLIRHACLLRDMESVNRAVEELRKLRIPDERIELARTECD